MALETKAAFAYHEPSIETVLNYSGLLLGLNIINICLDKLLYCGLIGQLFIGILWGTPGAQWLDQETERVIQQIGYLGLILLIYEGGLSTSIKSLKANILLSTVVALTGISVPMGFSFILKELVSATFLQAFAAGAALSATSLGTTFTILSTTQLTTTRLGVVATSAAMIDDVVGLVMVQIISNLGGSAASFSAGTVIRPVFVSLGFAVGLFLVCAFCLRPVSKIGIYHKSKISNFVRTAQFAFLAHTVFLMGIVAGATYAGTSSLFAAYLAGVIVSCFDELVAESKASEIASRPAASYSTSGLFHKHARSHQDATYDAANQTLQTPEPSGTQTSQDNSTSHDETRTGQYIYNKYYKEVTDRILLPLFFASIGFAIPVTEMFQGQIVWRGVIYAILMAIGKMVTALWLVRFSTNSLTGLTSILKRPFEYAHSCRSRPQVLNMPSKRKKIIPQKTESQTGTAAGTGTGTDEISSPTNSNQDESLTADKPSVASLHPTTKSRPRSHMSLPPKSKSLYPPFILGLAMVARGEVGYLIASIAESQGIFSSVSSSDGSSDIYLVVIWAISLCTLVGPIMVGTLVRRVKKLQQSREISGSGSDPLGVWGI